MTIVEAVLADTPADNPYAGVYVSLSIIDRFVTYAFLAGLLFLALSIVDIMQMHELDTHEIVKMNLRTSRVQAMSQNYRPIW